MALLLVRRGEENRPCLPHEISIPSSVNGVILSASHSASLRLQLSPLNDLALDRPKPDGEINMVDCTDEEKMVCMLLVLVERNLLMPLLNCSAWFCIGSS